ncbi:hypothetical protein CCACVL1_29044 [Corchorus capsularis]|uniref:Uncharacterized protein n=1 Tax=Corchorus capsularis TaxID=210143 RepID=A0A1R3G4A5_COCAP|nr:hypothetical protein CCACVL1_29044 [Corchorus capsularis]
MAERNCGAESLEKAKDQAEVEQRLKGKGKVETAQGNGENERGMRKN